jgi:hypothetical protein
MPMARLGGCVAGAPGVTPDVLRRGLPDSATGWSDMPPRSTAAAELGPTFDAAVQGARRPCPSVGRPAGGPVALRQGDAVLDGPSPGCKVVHGFLIGASPTTARVAPTVYGPSADDGRVAQRWRARPRPSCAAAPRRAMPGGPALNLTAPCHAHGTALAAQRAAGGPDPPTASPIAPGAS